MAAQDVRELIPRVRRALEGPVEAPGGLTDDQVEAITADAIADVILLTDGRWGHSLEVTDRVSETNVPLHYEIEPGLSLAEESMVAAQAGLNHLIHVLRDVKVSETLRNEGQEWSYQRSSTMIRDWLALLKDQRDRALDALQAQNPVLARYASILAVRDRVAAAQLEPWVGGQASGGMQIYP